MRAQRTLAALGVAFLVAATAASAADDGADGPDAAVEAPAAEAEAEPGAAAPDGGAAAEPGNDNFRIGFWVLDLFAIDREPRGETYRFLDLGIFRLLEVGQGPAYQSFSFFEMPDLLNLFTYRREDDTAEMRALDFQIVDLALVRQIQEAEDEKQLHVLRLPVIGSLYGTVTEPEADKEIYGYVYRREIER